MRWSVEARPRRWAAAASLAASLSLSCTWEHPVDVTLDYDPTYAAAVRSFILAVHRMDSCPTVETYTLDSHAGSRVHAQSFAGTGGEPVGNVSAGDYAFIGLGLTDDCVVVLGGCEEVMLDDYDASVGVPIDVEIELIVTTTLGNVCGSGWRCEAGRCVEGP